MNLTDPSNGATDRYIGEFGDVATFTCDVCHGFGADGMGPLSIQLLCNASGTWNDTQPTCQSMYYMYLVNCIKNSFVLLIYKTLFVM